MQLTRDEIAPSLIDEAGGMGVVFLIRRQTVAYESAYAVTARVLQPALLDFLS